jgi:transcriptional regulator NrdR family protein
MNAFVDEAAKEVHFVIKRGGEKQEFELLKVQNSILKAMEAVGKVDEEVAEKVARSV